MLKCENLNSNLQSPLKKQGMAACVWNPRAVEDIMSMRPSWATKDLKTYTDRTYETQWAHCSWTFSGSSVHKL